MFYKSLAPSIIYCLDHIRTFFQHYNFTTSFIFCKSIFLYLSKLCIFLHNCFPVFRRSKMRIPEFFSNMSSLPSIEIA